VGSGVLASLVRGGARVARGLARRAAERRFAWLGTALVLGGTAVRSLVFPVVVRGRHHRLLTVWWVPGDIWGTFRDGQVVAWLDFGHLYQAGTAMVTLPGTALVFSPVAAVANAFGLSTDFPLVVPHPTAWLVLGPFAVALGAVALCALDALAARLRVGRSRRAVLGVVGAGLLFPVIGLWGHPEDALAVGLVLYALGAAFDGRVVAAGWLTGAAIAVQPLVVLAVPVLLGVLGVERLVPFLVRAALPAAVLLVPVLAAAPHATWRAVVDQPNFPGVDHPTPWTALAPHLTGRGRDEVVAGGPGRLVAVVAALGLAPLARRWRDRPALVVCLVAVGLELRCLTESVMDPYYLWPALAVGLVAAARAGRLALGAVAAGALAVSALAELHCWWLTWWMATVGGSAVVVGVGVGAVWRWSRPAAGRKDSSSWASVPLGGEGAEAPACRPQPVPVGPGA
jgi:hypothetical protein